MNIKQGSYWLLAFAKNTLNIFWKWQEYVGIWETLTLSYIIISVSIHVHKCLCENYFGEMNDGVKKKSLTYQTVEKSLSQPLLSHSFDVLFPPQTFTAFTCQRMITAVNALWGLSQDTAPCIPLVGCVDCASRHGLNIQQHVCVWKKFVSTGKSKKQSRFLSFLFPHLRQTSEEHCGFFFLPC